MHFAHLSRLSITFNSLRYLSTERLHGSLFNERTAKQRNRNSKINNLWSHNVKRKEFNIKKDRPEMASDTKCSLFFLLLEVWSGGGSFFIRKHTTENEMKGATQQNREKQQKSINYVWKFSAGPLFAFPLPSRLFTFNFWCLHYVFSSSRLEGTENTLCTLQQLLTLPIRCVA